MLGKKLISPMTATFLFHLFDQFHTFYCHNINLRFEREALANKKVYSELFMPFMSIDVNLLYLKMTFSSHTVFMLCYLFSIPYSREAQWQNIRDLLFT